MWTLMRLPKLILSTIGAQAGRKAADPVEAEVRGAFVNGAAIESLGRMLECVPAPLFALDRNRQVTAANAAAGKLFGGAITGAQPARLPAPPRLWWTRSKPAKPAARPSPWPFPRARAGAASAGWWRGCRQSVRLWLAPRSWC